MALRRVFIVPFVLAVLAPCAAQADYTKVVTANRFTVLRLTNATSCETGVGYRWTKVPGETSASLKFRQNGAEAGLGGSPPYGNADPNYPAPSGLNQLFSESYFASAGDPNACEPVRRQKIEPSFSPTAQATLTIAGVAPKCTKARKALGKRDTAVKKLKARLKKAKSAKAKKSLKARLKKAKKDQTSAKKTVRKSC